jgi:putative DNA primase/helicase
MTDKLKTILMMVKRGCAVFPVVKGGKKPAVAKGVHAASKDPTRIKKRFDTHPEENWGMATGKVSGIIILDVDGTEGRANLKKLIASNERLPKTVTVETPNGWHFYFRAPGYAVSNSASRVAQGIDVRGDGGYVVVPGSATSDGVYRFAEGCSPDEVEIAPAPKWLLKEIGKKVPPAGPPVGSQSIPPGHRDRALAYADAAHQRELDRLQKAPLHQRNNTLNICAFKLGQFLPYGLLSSAVITDELTRVAKQIGLGDQEIRATIDSGMRAGQRQPRRLPFLKPSEQPPVKVAKAKKSTDRITVKLARLGENDTDNAQRFAKRLGAKVLHTRGLGWQVFDGKRWRHDDLGQVVELAKQTARLIADESAHLQSDDARAARSRFAEQSLSKGALDRMLDLAKSLVGAEDSRLDADPWLINVENGTIDLRTGHREKHDPRDLMTKIMPVLADRNAKCPLFLKFLYRITGDDSNLANFIQKAVGYSLTGITTEQVLFFVYGKSGNNGKSTLVNLVRDMLGDYGLHTPTETLVVKQYDSGIPADLARLDGARMVTAVEANFNRHLDEAKIKSMTGGEPITARFMRTNFFQFVPVFKLWLVANDRPHVRGTDEAFWRRMRVIPLTINIPKAERDRDLATKLRAEWPGILAWAVRGCLKWQKDGLGMPGAVERATKDWQKEMDHLKKFIAEKVDIQPGFKLAASLLLERYKNWCSQHGEQPLNVPDFNDRLQECLDVTHTRVKGRSWWRGIKVRD